MQLNVIPRPLVSRSLEGTFTFPTRPTIFVETKYPELERIARHLIDRIARPLNVKPDVAPLPDHAPPPGSVVMIINTSPWAQEELGPEGYEMKITPETIGIYAAAPAGAFYAVQTLLQMLPPEVFAGKRLGASARTIPCVNFQDAPRYPWRGYMLDVVREFLPKEYILETIDRLAAHKMNRLHLHLTDDQGWRVEIRKYPRLTEFGAWQIMDDGTKLGGFYTQEELREIVEYARERYVEIIPEIDMPGHTRAAAASYPEITCLEEQIPVQNHSGTTANIFCPSQERTYEFIADVLDEVMEIFPSQWIHIGGDEAHPGHWERCPKCHAKMAEFGYERVQELQPLFLRRVQKYVESKGRTMVGWDELCEGRGVETSAVVQGWRGHYRGMKAAALGHDVIISPAMPLYLDYPEGIHHTEAIYNFEPSGRRVMPLTPGTVLGVESPLWTEKVYSTAEADRLTYPRLCAMSELAWSDRFRRCWRDFCVRMETHGRRLTAMGVKWNDDATGVMVGEWAPEMATAPDGAMEWDLSEQLDVGGRYAFTLAPDGRADVRFTGAALLEDGEEVARSNRAGVIGWRDYDNAWTLTLKRRKADAKYALRVTIDPETDPSELQRTFGSVWIKRKGSAK